MKAKLRVPSRKETLNFNSEVPLDLEVFAEMLNRTVSCIEAIKSPEESKNGDVEVSTNEGEDVIACH